MKRKIREMETNKKVVIVLPTYNERDNIVKILDKILIQKHRLLGCELYVLVVDDNSPDGTGSLVKEYAQNNPHAHLLTGKKQGLGAAYIRGFKYAIGKMQADIVFQMDADFSHDPNDIPRFINEILLTGSDFVIGSRYTYGGSIPRDWSYTRKLNSKVGNIFARHIAGIKRVKDCTSGYRAIKVTVLKKIDLDRLNVKGYAFMVSLLYEAVRQKALISEIPIQFVDRKYGESKIRISDILEFILNAFLLRVPYLKLFLLLPIFIIVYFIGRSFHLFSRIVFNHVEHTVLIPFLILFSILISFQSILTIFWMLYAWEDPETIAENKSPKEYTSPSFSFTALVAARHEEQVIKDTIKAISDIDYPEILKETLVLCRYDDVNTITAVQKVISEINKDNIKLITFDSFPINKPHSLNIGLQHATKEVIVVFDAEDEPHREIYNIVNTVMTKKHADVVQSGVQLMNFRSSWFSTVNVLEYFFWFKSALHFFAKIGIVPLGGNTVFLKKLWLEKVSGWNEKLLTEDADIGIRLSKLGARIKIVYDEEHVTKEETPSTVGNFIRQRTRWNQGFIQVLFKCDWMKMKTLSQKLLAVYILLSPAFQAVMFIYLPISIFIALHFKLPTTVVMLSSVPIYLVVIQIVIYSIGLYEFTKEYKLQYPFWMPLKILFSFYPYQLLLGYSSFRALGRSVAGSKSWEKTLHVNAHRRTQLDPQFALS